MRFTITVSLALAVCSVISCGGAPAPSPVPTPAGPQFSFVLDGATVEGTVLQAGIRPSGFDGMSLSVIGGRSTDVLGFTTAAVVGTTNVGPASGTDALLGATGGAIWAANGMGGSGTVTITTLTSMMASGRFSFTLVPSNLVDSVATGTRTVTDGRFNVIF